ncbi:MAG TPA: MaoC family dehydratase N-terminal domain-containing protein, partial [Acidimicrobiales bacterium]|nr:MaoC family dehydratase N-terminal domain-containing protein [Acidimicrobiales bacterium]
AVNDEFIDVHMSADAARAAGQPDVFGMGNLRIAYVHNALHDWLDGAGDIAMFRCQFRQLNFLGDTLRATGRVTAKHNNDEGLSVVDLEIGVVNQRGEETMPGAARVVFFDDDAPRMPAPASRASVDRPSPGVHLDAATIDWLDRPLPVLRSLPVDANDIRRWAQAVYYPEPPPAEFFDIETANKGVWGGLVAPRDFNPYAWNPDSHPEAYPWMRGMGVEPGWRGLNGGQCNWYFAPIRVADVITSEVTLIDAFEREGRLGTMMFLIDEARWTNEQGELVRIGHRTSIYY